MPIAKVRYIQGFVVQGFRCIQGSLWCIVCSRYLARACLESFGRVEVESHCVALVGDEDEEVVALVRHLHPKIQLPRLLRLIGVDVASCQPRVEAVLLTVAFALHVCKRLDSLQIGDFVFKI